MDARRWTLVFLLAGCAATVQAQDDAPDWKRWTVRYYSALDAGKDFNAGGLASFLEEEGFDAREPGFFGSTLDYPLTSTEGGTGQSLLVAYAFRSWLKIGGSIHQGVAVNARGLRLEQDGRVRVEMVQDMWAVAPVALWTPASNVAVGAGPAVIRGTVTFRDGSFFPDQLAAKEESYVRIGAVAFASLGFTLFRRTLYFGVQGQYLYGGEVNVGPYDIEPHSVGVGGVRVDQFTLGPVVAVNL